MFYISCINFLTLILAYSINFDLCPLTKLGHLLRHGAHCTTPWMLVMTPVHAKVVTWYVQTAIQCRVIHRIVLYVALYRHLFQWLFARLTCSGQCSPVGLEGSSGGCCCCYPTNSDKSEVRNCNTVVTYLAITERKMKYWVQY